MKNIRFFIFTFIIFSLFMILSATNVKASTLWSDGFENGIEDWTLVDKDGDGENWFLKTDGSSYSYSGTSVILSKSYDNNLGPLSPDNYIISPPIEIPNDESATTTLVYYVANQDNYPEHYSVYIIDSEENLTSSNIEDKRGTSIHSETLPITKEFLNREINISNYKGKTIRIAFRHHDSHDNFIIKIDDVSVESSLLEYNITSTIPTNGTFTVDKTSAMLGTTINITTNPNDGYRVKSVKVNDGDITVTNNGTNYTFSMPEENVTVNVEFELITKTVAIRKMENGTVTSDKETVTPGETVTLTVTPSEGYKLKEIKLLDKFDENPVTLNEDNTFTMPSYNVFIAAEFELIYTEKTITKTADDMTASVKGTFSGDPVLVVTKTEKGNEGYNSLVTLVKEDKEVIGSYDVTITGGTYTGELELIFTVGKQYEGYKITIYHKKASGDVETLTATVKDGKVVITVSEVSPFMLVADKTEQKDATPKTGDNNYVAVNGIILLAIGSSIVILRKKLIKK